MPFSSEEADACRALIRLALAEDLGIAGDITSAAIIPPSLVGQGVFIARNPGVLAGWPAVPMVAASVDPQLTFETWIADGAPVEPGARIAQVRGPMQNLLTFERTALNFLQHLSGIATLTRKYVDAVAGLPVRVLDTRKTIPGWRLLAKYAVRQGGGHNHRLGLADGVLIKDNHLAGLQIDDFRLQIEEGVGRVRAACPGLSVEIEVANLDQLDCALTLRPEIVLLDNMSVDMLKGAVLRRAQVAPRVQLEASGGVNLRTIRAIAETGVERISVGALTHSAPALDIALDYEA